MGDNRNNSHDSRGWWEGKGGGVPFENIKGRALIVWMSFAPQRDRAGPHRHHRDGPAQDSAGQVAVAAARHRQVLRRPRPSLSETDAASRARACNACVTRARCAGRASRTADASASRWARTPPVLPWALCPTERRMWALTYDRATGALERDACGLWPDRGRATPRSTSRATTTTDRACSSSALCRLLRLGPRDLVSPGLRRHDLNARSIATTPTSRHRPRAARRGGRGRHRRAPHATASKSATWSRPRATSSAAPATSAASATRTSAPTTRSSASATTAASPSTSSCRPRPCGAPTPTRIRPEVAAMQEPFGNAVHACTKVNLRGKRVAIVGCGTIGLFAVAVARAHGRQLHHRRRAAWRTTPRWPPPRRRRGATPRRRPPRPVARAAIPS